MMAELVESIENATVIERGISPLMANMLNALEDFVELDVCRLRLSVLNRRRRTL